LAGCAPNRLAAAAATKAAANQVPLALSVADEERRIGRALPDYPAACRRTYSAGIRQGDRLDAALLKTDRALSRANGQIVECAGWYDEIRKGIAR